MTTKSNALIFLIAWGTLIAASVRGGVYDDCVAWWHFDYDRRPTELEKTSWLFNTGMEWNKYFGWLFGVSSNTYPRLMFYSPRASSAKETAAPTTPSAWISTRQHSPVSLRFRTAPS